MPCKSKTLPRGLPSIPKGLIDQLASGPMTAGSIEDLSAALKNALIERALGASSPWRVTCSTERQESTQRLPGPAPRPHSIGVALRPHLAISLAGELQ